VALVDPRVSRLQAVLAAGRPRTDVLDLADMRAALHLPGRASGRLRGDDPRDSGETLGFSGSLVNRGLYSSRIAVKRALETGRVRVGLPASAGSSSIPGAQSGPRGRVLPVEEMAGKTAVAGVAVVQGSSVRRDDRNGMIYTDYRLRFTEVWKGDPGPDFVLMKAGGQIGDRATAIAGQDYVLEPGESIVVFASASGLGHHTVMGLRQGLYRVGAGPERPLLRESEKGTAAPSIPLRELKEQVFKALGKEIPAEPVPAPADKAAPVPLPADAPTPHAQVPVQGASPAAPDVGGTSRGSLGAIVGILLLLAVAWAFLRRRHERT
jgi:hypothetical protein